MAEDITVRSAEGRPVDPEVPGSAADMDVAVAVLLAMHDDRRTDGLPPWPPTWAVYGHMWEERDKATREVDRLRAENAALAAALEDIAGMVLRDRWVADATCAGMNHVCHHRYPDDPGEWCPVCVAEICWCAWKIGVLG